VLSCAGLRGGTLPAPRTGEVNKDRGSIVIRRLLLLAAILSPFPLSAQQSSGFVRGADLSFVPQIEDLGGTYKLNGVQKDVLDIFRENGANYVRLRIWHTPTNGYCGLAQTLEYALRVKAKGFKLHIDFHYSDWWADPGKQNKPAAWSSLTFTQLKDSVYAYTKNVIEALKNQNTLPDMVQIGNEITAGMLWPDGKIPTSNPTLAWQQFGELVKEGIRGARDAAADSSIKIMIHIDRGGDYATSQWFFDNLLAQGAQFDVIGLSYYPWWHGSLAAMQSNLNGLAARYGKEIILAETAYPWTTQSLNDGMGNITVDPAKLPAGYSISVQGQKAFLAKITKILKETYNNKGLGFFYWEPAYISVSPIGSSWEHLTTFDFTGAALTTLTAFMDLDSIPTVNVKLRVNTATNADTLKVSGLVQVRGEVKGVGSSLLPSGELFTWDSYSGVILQNVGGDYWEYQLKMYASDRLEYKIWTGHSASTPTYLRLGWEGPITPFDSSGVNARAYTAAGGDTTLEIEFYNSRGVAVDQYWSPFQVKGDSLGVLFRVNMAALTSSGLFDPTVHGPLAVRGDSAASGGRLSWARSTVVLQRETVSVASGSFWSKVAYFPRSSIAAGTPIHYKFFVENSSFGGWEYNISDRVFTFPARDTTLNWQFFNNRLLPTGVEEGTPSLPAEVELAQNYPNPFNPVTLVRYSLTRSSHVTLSVSNILGQVIATLVEETQSPGVHSTAWDGRDDSGRQAVSGIYFLRLEAEGLTRIRKMVLLK
jgi:arabinogalactan endo-1,4-beta-galactosidase